MIPARTPGGKGSVRFPLCPLAVRPPPLDLERFVVALAARERAIFWRRRPPTEQHVLSLARSQRGQKRVAAICIFREAKQGSGSEDIAESINEFMTGNAPKQALSIARSKVISGNVEGSLDGYR
jgi:hypothetical protein